MDKRERLTLIQLALGKVSVDFMRQSEDVMMPTKALLETASQIEEIWAQEIAALESQLDRYRWRRVEDEMPATSQWVLARHASSQLPYVKFWDASLSGVREATHWMPLPPAPEEWE